MVYRSNRTKILGLIGGLLLLYGYFLGSNPQWVVALESSPPPPPVVYYGNVTITGDIEGRNFWVVGKIAPVGGLFPDYVSPPQPVVNGKYDLLAVGPPSVTYLNQVVTFHLYETLGYEIQAAESDPRFTGGPRFTTLNLTFPSLPPTPTPTPTPEPTPTPTPIPTPQPTPIPTPVPTPVATPDPTPMAPAIPPPPPAPTPDIAAMIEAAVAAALATPEPEEEETGRICGRSSNSELSTILGLGVLFGVVFRRRGRNQKP